MPSPEDGDNTPTNPAHPWSYYDEPDGDPDYEPYITPDYQEYYSFGEIDEGEEDDNHHLDEDDEDEDDEDDIPIHDLFGKIVIHALVLAEEVVHLRRLLCCHCML